MRKPAQAYAPMAVAAVLIAAPAMTSDDFPDPEGPIT